MSSRVKSKKPKRKKKAGARKRLRSSERKTGPRKFSSVRLGQRIGRIFGPTGSNIGAEAGRLFRQLTGFGEYKVSRNSLTSGIDRLPTFGNMRQGTRVTHREFLGDVVTSSIAGGFKNQVYPLNPALGSTFPWLAASAENYEEYTIEGAVMEFKSNSYDAIGSTNTASGTVVLTTQYNVLSPPFTNKFVMEQQQYTCTGKPSVDLLHPIECDKKETPSHVLFTRAGPVLTGDLRLYDWGNFNIATVGMQGTSVNIGELWITYDIVLYKPRLGSAVDLFDHYRFPSLAVVAQGGPQYFGPGIPPNMPIKSAASDLGTTLVASTGTALDTIVWPAGYTGLVMVLYTLYRPSVIAGAINAPYVWVYADGAAAFPLFTNGTATNEGPPGAPMVYAASGGTTLVTFAVIINGGRMRLTGGSTSGLNTSGELYIFAIPPTTD